jgi:serine protease AprX
MDLVSQNLPRSSRGLSWGRRTAGASVVAFLLASGLSVAPASAAPAGGTTSVIVERTPGSGERSAAAVAALGGEVGTPLGIIDGFEAEVPTASIGELREAPGVADVTVDAAVTMLASTWRDDVDLGGLPTVLDGAGVSGAWSATDARGRILTGKGVGVALIDSGVVPVEGLTTPGKVVNGPDLSFDSQHADAQHLDAFGHGTHLAGIIAGKDAGAGVTSKGTAAAPGFVGVAPDATVVNVKVAASDGAVDVSQIIAALDWTVQHRNDNGMNIRVVNLSFGTDGTQPYQLDPLAHAVESAWRNGLLVVVAVGNGGNLTETVSNPATDPFVLAVGASDHKGTSDRRDDVVADFSSRGSAARTPDLVAPGRSIVSLRSPGSAADLGSPNAVVNDGRGAPRLFRGSGSSQSAAIVAGSAALLLQQRPELTPDQLKKLLTSTATSLKGTDVRLQGAGLLDVQRAVRTKTPSIARSVQPFAPSTGHGTLQGARGSGQVTDPATGTPLVGEQDIMGAGWDATTWAALAAAGQSWSGGDWNGQSWSGQSWSGQSWSGQSWSGQSWSGQSWSGQSWSGQSWSGQSWSASRGPVSRGPASRGPASRGAASRGPASPGRDRTPRQR